MSAELSLSAKGQPQVHSSGSGLTQAIPPARHRLVALDGWRGLTILLMLLVNNIALGPYTPPQLMHAHWGAGMTLTDLVFPWFLYCAGAALPFSLGKRSDPAEWRLDASTRNKLLIRTVKMYLVGAALTSLAGHHLTLGLGVLQLIALASLCAGLMARLDTRTRLLTALALLFVYQLFLLSAPFGEADNAVTHLNALLLGRVGLRGLTSVLPATALVLLGSVAAQALRDREHEVKRLLSLGAALCVAGWLVSLLMGYNKTYWTPSYVLMSSGLATLGLLTLYLTGDSNEGRYAKVLLPLTIAGRNSLFAYVVPIAVKLTVLSIPVYWTGQKMSILSSILVLLQRQWGVVTGGWMFTLGYLGVVWLVLWYLWRRHYIWKL